MQEDGRMSLDVAALSLELTVAGYDIVQPLSTAWYNDHVAQQQLPLAPLPSLGREGGALVILIGNSRYLWNAFLRWLRTQPDPLAIAEPLDTYTKATITGAVTKAAGGAAHDIFWAAESGERLVSMQRVALVSGLCCHDSETQLSVCAVGLEFACSFLARFQRFTRALTFV